MKKAILILFASFFLFSFVLTQRVEATRIYNMTAIDLQVTPPPSYPTPTSLSVGNNFTIVCNYTITVTGSSGQQTANNFQWWAQYNSTPAGAWLNFTNSLSDTNFTADQPLPNTTSSGLVGGTYLTVPLSVDTNRVGYTMTRCMGFDTGSKTTKTGTVIRNVTITSSAATILTYANNVTSNPTNYDGSTLSWFNATWSDTTCDSGGGGICFNTSLLETNYAGSLKNYTMSGDGNISYYSMVLPAGTFQWRIIANDSANVQNATPVLTFTINKGSLGGSISGSSVTYPTAVNIIPTESNNGGDADVNYTFWRNTSVGGGTLFNSAIGSSPASDTTLLGAGTYSWILNTSAGPFQNYSASSSIAIQTYTVNQGSLSLTINSNVTSPITYPTASSVTGNGCSFGSGYGTDVICTLYRGNSSFTATGDSAQDNTLLTVGVYVYNYSTPGGTNWTANSATNYTLIVQTGGIISNINITLNVSQVWWQDAIYASGYTTASQTVSLYSGNTLQCTTTSAASGFWNCVFNAPTGIGIYTVSANTSSYSASTNLNVFPFYGQKGIGNEPRVVYEVPFLIQDFNGNIQKVFVRVNVAK